MLAADRSRRWTPDVEHWVIWLLLTIFAVVGFVRFRHESGEDLASSYLGCRLLATGHADALYNYDPDSFAGIGPGDLWQKAAKAGHFTGFIHPYVQTPLWGYGLEPVCMHTSFPVFNQIFLALIMLSFAGSIWLIARYWSPSLFHPLPIALALLCFWFSQPFQYAMFLMQTHALFFLLAIASLILAQRDKPMLAGLLLACAAAVKVTPGFLLIYWLFTRRWKAAISFLLCSAALMVVTVLTAGTHLVSVYFADLHRISRVLLLAENNQSFAAWVMGRFYPFDEVFDSQIFVLPTAVRLGSTLFMVAFTALGGWIDQQRRPADEQGETLRPPAGATMALVATTIFAPIAWTHYSVVLVAPIMVLLEEARRLRSWWLAALPAAIAILNFHPLASDVISMDVGDYALLRGQFFAGVLCLAGVSLVVWLRRGQRASALA